MQKNLRQIYKTFLTTKPKTAACSMLDSNIISGKSFYITTVSQESFGYFTVGPRVRIYEI